MAGHWGGIGLARSSVLWQLGSGHWGIPLFFGHFFFGVGLFLASCLEVWIWLIFLLWRGECGGVGVDGGGWGVPLWPPGIKIKAFCLVVSDILTYVYVFFFLLFAVILSWFSCVRCLLFMCSAQDGHFLCCEDPVCTASRACVSSGFLFIVEINLR